MKMCGRGKKLRFKGVRSEYLPVGQEWQRPSIGVVLISRVARIQMCVVAHQQPMEIFVGSILRNPYVFLELEEMTKEMYLPGPIRLPS